MKNCLSVRLTLVTLFLCLLTLVGCGYVAEKHLVEQPTVTEVSIIPSKYLSAYEHDTLVTIRVEVTNASFKNLSPAEGVIWKLFHQARDLGADAITGLKIAPCHTHVSGVTYRLAVGEATAVVVHSDEVHREKRDKTLTAFVRVQSSQLPPTKSMPMLFRAFLEHYNYRMLKTIKISIGELSANEEEKTEEALMELCNRARLAGANAISELSIETQGTDEIAQALAIELYPGKK